MLKNPKKFVEKLSKDPCKILKRSLKELINLPVVIFYYIKYLVIELINSNTITVIGYFTIYKWKIGQYNFGDDLNLHLIKLISGKRVIPKSYSILSLIFNKISYSCIGSIITYADKNTIIWGSGFLSDEISHKIDCKEVLAVRGPLSRYLLIQNDIKCPEIYGDPALLLPLFYRPISIKNKWKVGIIPHRIDKKNLHLKRFENNPNIKIFDIQHIGLWSDFIDNICSCNVILSSSLHGLIISDAYSIPNFWIEISDKLMHSYFKFIDYYLSISKEINEPIKLEELSNIDEISELIDKWQKPSVNLEPLLKSCPFYSSDCQIN